MNNSDFKEQAEKYKSELMSLYNAKPKKEQEDSYKNISENENTEQNTQENEVKEQNITPDNKEDENTEHNTNDPEKGILGKKSECKKNTEEITKEDIERRFPEPTLPDFIKKSEPPVKNDSFGYLKVSVRTGSGGIPIENSTVTVSQTVDGKEEILRILMTDSSGDTGIIKLPAPKKPIGNQPEDFEHHAEYNITAFYEGYFRESSRRAPIFEGITSIQTFYLIPEPFNYDSNADTINYQNQEPNI